MASEAFTKAGNGAGGPKRNRRIYRARDQETSSVGEAGHSGQGRVLCAADGRDLRSNIHSQAEDQMGKLQPRGEPEFQLPADDGTTGGAGLRRGS